MKYILSIFLICALAYLPITEAGYIWDDDQYLTENTLVRSLDGLKDIWTTTKTPQYYPMVFSSYLLEFNLWQYNALGYHLTNVLLHICSSLLLFVVLKKLNIPLAFAIATIFAVHPIQVESVAWITERKNVLSMFFYLATLLNYLKYIKLNKIIFYFIALACFIFALLSKSTAYTLPVIFVLILHFQNKKINYKDLLLISPFFITGLILGLNTAHLEKTKVGAIGKAFDFNFLQKILIASKTSLFYIQKILLPYPLIFNYKRWEIDKANIVDFWPCLLWLAIFYFLYLLWKKNYRLPTYLTLAYLVSLFPALGFFAVYPFKYSFVADHFSYLATPYAITGICLSINQIIKDESTKKLVFYFCLTIFMILTFNQTKIYKNEEAIWLDTIAKNPCSRLAINNLGGLYRKQNRIKLALLYFDRAIECTPENHKAYLNKGTSLVALRRFEEAISSLNQALKLHKNYPSALTHRAMAKYFTGKYSEALEDLNLSLKMKPDYALALGYRAMSNFELNADLNLICKDFDLACKFGKCDFLKLKQAQGCTK